MFSNRGKGLLHDVLNLLGINMLEKVEKVNVTNELIQSLGKEEQDIPNSTRTCCLGLFDVFIYS